MAIYQEKTIHPALEVAILLIAILGICFPYFIELRELYDRESMNAVMAHEISWRAPWCTVYGELVKGYYPLYPLLTKWVMGFGYSIEFSLRIVGVGALLFVAGLTYNVAFEASKRHYENAGVAAAVVLSSLCVVDRAMLGCEDFLAVGFIFSAWMLLFSLGLYKNMWVLAWSGATILVLLAFFTLGWSMLILFYVPILVQPVPFSGFNKLRRNEAVLSTLVIAFVIFLWYYFEPDLPIAPYKHSYEFSIFKTLIAAPFELIVRFLPWSLLIYPAFCAAYRPMDPNEFFSRYIRTLFLASVVIIICLPNFDFANEGKILIPLTGLLVAIHYTAFIRRNGSYLTKLLRFSNWLVLALLISLIGFYLILGYLDAFVQFCTSHHLLWLNQFFDFIEKSWLSFEDLKLFRINNLILILIALFLQLIYFFVLRKRTPLWCQIVWFVLTVMLIHWSFVIPRRTLYQPSRLLALEMIEQMSSYENGPLYGRTLYRKRSASPLYAALAYANFNMKNVTTLRELPTQTDSVIYLLSDDIPAPLPNFKWNEKECFKVQTSRGPLYIWLGTTQEKNPLDAQNSQERSSLLP